MSTSTKKLTDLLKSLTSVTNATGKSAVLTDSSGALAKIASSILGVEYTTRDGAGAALLYKGYALVFAVDTADKTKSLLYSFCKPSGTDLGKTTVIYSSGGLEVQATNSQGTVALQGFTSYANVVQHVLKFQ